MYVHDYKWIHECLHEWSQNWTANRSFKVYLNLQKVPRLPSPPCSAPAASGSSAPPVLAADHQVPADLGFHGGYPKSSMGLSWVPLLLKENRWFGGTTISGKLQFAVLHADSWQDLDVSNCLGCLGTLDILKLLEHPWTTNTPTDDNTNTVSVWNVSMPKRMG